MEEKQPRKRVRNSISGSGMNFLPSDINSLKEKLQLLLGEYTAGNKTTCNQIVAILDNLRGRKKISKKECNHVNRLLQLSSFRINLRNLDIKEEVNYHILSLS